MRAVVRRLATNSAVLGLVCFAAGCGPSGPFEAPLDPKLTPLMSKVVDGDLAGVRRLAASGVDLSATDITGATALHYASKRADPDIAKALLVAGAPVNARDHSSCTALAVAGRFGRVATAQAIAKAGGTGLPELNVTAFIGTAGQVAAALKRAPSSKGRDCNGWTALHYAAMREDSSIAVALARAGYLADARGPDGRTPLHIAAEFGRDNTLLSLLRRTPRPGIKDWISNTPLHYAASHNRTSTCRLLLAERAPVDALNDGGDTPLVEACRCGHHAVAAVLLDHGASVDTARGVPLYPLHELSRLQACRGPEAAYILLGRLLRQHGADASKRDFAGLSPAERAKEAGLHHLAESLRISAGGGGKR